MPYLFDFCVIQLERVVDPGQQLSSTRPLALFFHDCWNRLEGVAWAGSVPERMARASDPVAASAASAPARMWKGQRLQSLFQKR